MTTFITYVPAAFLLSFLIMEVSGDAIGQSGVCAGLPDGYFVRDVSNCQGYYFCRGGMGSYNVCPDAFYYNELRQLCDYPDEVTCHICQEQTGVQIFPHPDSCNQFITCSEGVSYVGQCTEGYVFDRRMKICNPAARVECDQQPRCPEQDNQNQIVYLAGVERCDEYFICRSGIPVPMVCAPGLHWDATNERCELAGLVSCALRVNEALD